MKIARLSLPILITLLLACGEDRYPCDDPGNAMGPVSANSAQNPDPDGGGYAPPDCKSTDTNGETQ